MSKYVTHHNWRYIKFGECPKWLKNRAKSYANKNHPVNVMVQFKGKHFRYNVYYDNNCNPWKVYRRLRWKHKPQKHKKWKPVKRHRPHTFKESIKNFGAGKAIWYRFKRIVPPKFLGYFGAMVIVAILHQFIYFKFLFITLPLIYYILEIVVVGYVMFIILKLLDNISVSNDLRLFGLRILSGIVSLVGIYLLYMFLITGFPILLAGNIHNLKNYYQFMGLEDFYDLFVFGQDFNLPLTGMVIFVAFAFSLTLIGGYLFFKFQRRTGNFVWFGRI